MPDVNDVIMHLQIIHVWTSFAMEHDITFLTEKHYQNISKWTDEAAELLKCSKPAEPVKPVIRINDNGFRYCYCGDCGFELMAGQPKFCSECGRAVKWKK